MVAAIVTSQSCKSLESLKQRLDCCCLSDIAVVDKPVQAGGGFEDLVGPFQFYEDTILINLSQLNPRIFPFLQWHGEAGTYLCIG